MSSTSAPASSVGSASAFTGPAHDAGGGTRALDLKTIVVAPEVLTLVPHELARRFCVLPVGRRGTVLTAVVPDPLATANLDCVAHAIGLAVEPIAADETEILRAIERCHGPAGMPAVPAAESTDEPGPSALTELDDATVDAPVIKLVHALIDAAVRRRASDIHFEPLERRFRVRYRIDGALIEMEDPPKRLQRAIISRLKIMANISIAEKRVPQDGRIQVAIGGRPLDLRVSSLPTAHGESVVMRLLDQQGVKLGLPELGFAADDQRAFEEMIATPDGMVLVTGPTGSGKTTTLYSCLHHLNRSDRKIISVEDPVEYQLTGINQAPVRPEIGMTFASALRAILRQAPNIIMIGEIRDLETAEIAMNASLTGHVVFSTLHTNDAIGAAARLIDLGVKPFLVASSLRGVLAQRLVRKTCEKCRQPHLPSAAELAALGLDGPASAKMNFMRGAGCRECHGTGYRGRLGIFEVLAMDEPMRRLVHENAGRLRLRAHAREAGLRTLRMDGARKAAAGLTTVEEVLSITTADAS